MVTSKSVPFYSSPLQLGFGDNIVPGSNNEVITLKRFDYCYQISSNATNIKLDSRTFTLDFDERIHFWDLPVALVMYATSFENSFAVERVEFFHGKPEITQILMNHHTTISFKMKRTEVLKEKHTDCNEQTYWEVLEKMWYPRIVENCSNPCFPFKLPGEQLPQCQYSNWGGTSDDDNGFQSFGNNDDRLCAWDAFHNLVAEEGEIYNFKSCSIEEYEGRVLQDNIIPGKPELWYWDESDKQDKEIVFPFSDYQYNPGNLTVKFSYTFDSPQTMTVDVENFIVSFFDLIGIVGGTLGMFIGFVFYDNILAAVEYLIIIVEWVKRITQKRNASKVSDVKKSTKDVASKVEMELPKQEVTSKQEIPQQVQEKVEEIAKFEDHSILQKCQKTENSVDTNPKAETMSQNQDCH